MPDLETSWQSVAVVVWPLESRAWKATPTRSLGCGLSCPPPTAEVSQCRHPNQRAEIRHAKTPARCGASYPARGLPSSSSEQSAMAPSRCRTRQPLHIARPLSQSSSIFGQLGYLYSERAVATGRRNAVHNPGVIEADLEPEVDGLGDFSSISQRQIGRVSGGSGYAVSSGVRMDESDSAAPGSVKLRVGVIEARVQAKRNQHEGAFYWLEHPPSDALRTRCSIR